MRDSGEREREIYYIKTLGNLPFLQLMINRVELRTRMKRKWLKMSSWWFSWDKLQNPAP